MLLPFHYYPAANAGLGPSRTAIWSCQTVLVTHPLWQQVARFDRPCLPALRQRGESAIKLFAIPHSVFRALPSLYQAVQPPSTKIFWPVI